MEPVAVGVEMFFGDCIADREVVGLGKFVRFFPGSCFHGKEFYVARVFAVFKESMGDFVKEKGLRIRLVVYVINRFGFR